MQSERTTRLIEQCCGLKMTPEARYGNRVSQVAGFGGPEMTREKARKIISELPL